MKKIILIATLAALSIIAPAQKVDIKSKGDDIRKVIASVFEQANQQYVLETGVRQSLYMSLEGISLEKAMQIIGDVAELSFNKREGIWYINTRRFAKMNKPSATPPTTHKETEAHKFGPISEPKKAEPKKIEPKKTEPIKMDPMKSEPITKTPTKIEAGKVTAPKSEPTKKFDMQARLTTKLQKTDIREVFAEFARQTGAKIEVTDTVPNYKIDAYMFNTSLKFALDRVCAAAGLKYETTSGKTVRISKA
jgi:hypothetical protein